MKDFKRILIITLVSTLATVGTNMVLDYLEKKEVLPEKKQD